MWRFINKADKAYAGPPMVDKFKKKMYKIVIWCLLRQTVQYYFPKANYKYKRFISFT